MMPDDAKPLVVFVPGIMGSVLRYRGPGEHGGYVDEDAWGSDPSALLDVLARRPRRLTSEHLVPTEVLRHVSGKVFFGIFSKHEEFYGPFLDFCTGASPQGLALDGSQFVPFPYDWRQDNRESAKSLGERIKSLDPEGKRKIGLVAHSMGGLVCRLLLVTDASIARRVQFFLQVASPVAGSAKAFHTLREGPLFTWIMDRLLGAAYRLDPQIKSELISALRSFRSIYQLLPPLRDRMLITNAGERRSAVDDEVWLPEQRDHLRAAREVHTLLESPISVPIRCVYSHGHPTDLQYRVDAQYLITAWHRERFGDGTVVQASAFEGTQIQDRCPLPGDSGATSHDELPRHDEVKGLLRQLLGKKTEAEQ